MLEGILEITSFIPLTLEIRKLKSSLVKGLGYISTRLVTGTQTFLLLGKCSSYHIQLCLLCISDLDISDSTLGGYFSIDLDFVSQKHFS